MCGSSLLWNMCFCSKWPWFSLHRSQSHLLSSWRIGAWKILIISSQRRITAPSPTTKLSASLSGELQVFSVWKTFWRRNKIKKGGGQELGFFFFFFGTSRQVRDTSSPPRTKAWSNTKIIDPHILFSVVKMVQVLALSPLSSLICLISFCFQNHRAFASMLCEGW